MITKEEKIQIKAVIIVEKRDTLPGSVDQEILRTIGREEEEDQGLNLLIETEIEKGGTEVKVKVVKDRKRRRVRKRRVRRRRRNTTRRAEIDHLQDLDLDEVDLNP